MTSPISIVVDRIAALVANAWENVKSEHIFAANEEETAFLILAYRYLSERQSAVYIMERAQHMAAVEERYQAPPSIEELYGTSETLHPLVALLLVSFLGILAVLGVFSAATLLNWIVSNFDNVLDSLRQFLFSGGALAIAIAILVPWVLSSIGVRFIPKKLEYAFEKVGDSLPWQMFQTNSSERIDSERAQILGMVGSSVDTGSAESTTCDVDVSEAKTNPVPIQPGIAEYVLSTNRVRIEDLSNDFQETKNQHTKVFWLTFTAFMACLFITIAAALVYKLDIRVLGGLGGISGVLGTFSYRMLGKARLARICLALFNSYVIELEDRLTEANAIQNVREARKLRSAAWTNFRSGLNKLYSLEQRGNNRKS